MRTRQFPAAFVHAALAMALAPEVLAQIEQRLSFTGGALFNVEVNFRNLGGFVPAGNPGMPTGGAINRAYDDGFNGVDATGNAGDTTANWGYQEVAQVRGQTLVMASHSSPGGASIDDAGDSVFPSGNLEYRGSLGYAGECHWGVLAGVGYAPLEADSSETLRADATRLEDAFSLAGTPASALPPPPYAGTAGSQGPRIGSVPTRSTNMIPGGLLISGGWEFEADLVPITAGLYLECPLAPNLTTVLGAGGIAAWIDGRFSYHEANTIGTLPPYISQGESNENDFIFGGFVELGLNWQVWEYTSLIISGRWQPMESFELQANERRVEVKFDSSFAAYAGFAVSF